ncbi:MAG: hypothetical protein JOZ32_10740 [Bryobacterales bacterium]|nr:hypothetical protein [Bryobacterales bacterium]
MVKLTGLAILFSIALSLPGSAQWIHYPTPGIPRTADGKPDLSAPAPRTADGKPDLSGLWRVAQASSGETDKALHALKAQPWAQELSKKRKENLGREDMSVLCLPFGPRASFGFDKIVQTPSLIVLLSEDLTYRQIFMDGRPLPADPNPDWMGYSIGHWDGDTLVIESAGFNDRTWLDGDGHPHSEALHVTERLRRPDFGHLELVRTLDDPKALAEKLVIPLKMELDADTEMLEYVCAENERDRSHLIGKAEDDKQKEVQVAPEILKLYVGTYDLRVPDRPTESILVDISLEGDHLMASVSGGVKHALTAISDSKFYFEGFHLAFFKDEHGAVTHLIAETVEGDLKAIRK